MNTYVFDSSTKKKLFLSFGIGALLLLLGILFFEGNSSTVSHEAAKHETAAVSHETAKARQVLKHTTVKLTLSAKPF